MPQPRLYLAAAYGSLVQGSDGAVFRTLESVTCLKASFSADLNIVPKLDIYFISALIIWVTQSQL